jgi:outer membrane protein TolC
MSNPVPVFALLAILALPASAAPAAMEPSPLTLRRAAELAAERAPGLAVARAAARQGEAAHRVAEDAFHPEAYLSTTPGYGRGLPVAVSGRVPSIVGLEMHQSLYDPERRAEEIKARVVEEDARAAVERARRDAARAAAQLFARSWADERLLATAGRRQEAFTRLRERSEALEREGRITGLQLAQARLREARARLRREDLVVERDLDRGELRRLTGWTEDAPLDLAAEPLASLPQPPAGGDLAAAEAADPELRAQGEAVELFGRVAALRRHSFAPVVDAGAQYSRLPNYRSVNQYYRKFKADDWSLGVTIAVPLWSSGRIADATAQAEANLNRLQEQQRAREAEIASEVRKAVAAEARAQAAADLGRQAVAVGAEALKMENALAAEGRAGADEVAAREADLADAEEESVRAVASLAEARAALLALRGDLPGAAPQPAK